MDPKIAKSRAQEQRGAALHGGRRTVGSGNTPWQKGDVRTNRWGIEYKRTDKKQIIIKVEDVEKNRKAALLAGRGPLFGIELGGRDLVLVEAEYLAELEERASGAGTALGAGPVLPTEGRSVLPRDRPRVSKPAQRSEGRVPRHPRYSSVPDPGDVS